MAENKMEMDPEVLQKSRNFCRGCKKRVKAFYICDRRFKQHLEQRSKRPFFAKLPEGPGGSFGNGRAVHRSGRRTPGDRR